MVVQTHNVFDRWPLEDKSVQAVITSPPYWALRKYDIPDTIIGGRSECQHEFSETFVPKGNGDKQSRRRDKKSGIGRGLKNPGNCNHCGAWKGQYGLEPSFNDYVTHTLLWAQEAWRVLKDDGVFFLNLGDSYGGSWGDFGDGAMRGNQKRKRQTERWKRNGAPREFAPPTANARAKCKLLIPHRVAIGLIDAGWTLRNDLVWRKPNAMPESTADRFSKTFEYVFMFVKQTKYYFNLDAVREKHAITSLQREGRNHYAISVPDHVLPDGQKQNNPTSLDRKGKNPGDVWSINTQVSPEEHYAMWPEKLAERMILCSTKTEDTVIDPFCGSGTTLRVAEKLNRTGIGFDLGYQDIQRRRLKNIEKELNLR